MRHLITPLDLTVDELNDILALAGRIYRNKEKYSKICDGKKLASLFYEPSTRTRLSFEAAMMNLGGSVLQPTQVLYQKAKVSQTQYA